MTIYSLTTCAPCNTAKWLLNRKQIDYEEEDFNLHREKLISLGFHKAPVFKVGDKYTSLPQRAIEWLDNTA